MNRLFIYALLAALLPAVSAAEDTSYTCTYEGLQRRVEIVTEPGVSVPCEVHYYKDSEAPGEREVLWRASNDAEYCETKTAEFIGQLLAWGWTCGQGDAAVPLQEPQQPVLEPESRAPADEEVLAPADEDVLAPGEAGDDTDR